MIENWRERCLRQQAIRDASLPKEWILKELPSPEVTNIMSIPYSSGIMTNRELSLTELDATELLVLLAKGQVSSFELTLAFCKRATIAQQLVSILILLNTRIETNMWSLGELLDDFIRR
jgi:amidase